MSTLEYLRVAIRFPRPLGEFLKPFHIVQSYSDHVDGRAVEVIHYRYGDGDYSVVLDLLTNEVVMESSHAVSLEVVRRLSLEGDKRPIHLSHHRSQLVMLIPKPKVAHTGPGEDRSAPVTYWKPARQLGDVIHIQAGSYQPASSLSPLSRVSIPLSRCTIAKIDLEAQTYCIDVEGLTEYVICDESKLVDLDGTTSIEGISIDRERIAIIEPEDSAPMPVDPGLVDFLSRMTAARMMHTGCLPQESMYGSWTQHYKTHIKDAK